MRPNWKMNPLDTGIWRGRPMNAVRLQTIILNKLRNR